MKAMLDNMSEGERRGTLLVLAGGSALAACAIARTLVDVHSRRKMLNRNEVVAVDLASFWCVCVCVTNV